MPANEMERWRKAWREIAARLPAGGLRELLAALHTNNPELVQGMTGVPRSPGDSTCIGGCAISFCGWKTGAFKTINGAYEYLARATYGVRHSNAFLDWFDLSPRAEMLVELLPEVELALQTKLTESAR